MTVAPVEAILRDLARCPAASFHEERVAAAITRFLSDSRSPFSVDVYGNILAHYQAGQGAPPIAAVAHMDHPAFEISQGGAQRAEASLLGGVAQEFLQEGTPVRVFSSGRPVAGRVRACRRAGETAPLLLDLEVRDPVATGDWGVWEMDDFREDGEYFHLRAADDLAGCALALAALAVLREQTAAADFYAVFTRAEEVGLIGATLVAQQRLLPEGTIVVSLESSKVLPGVEQGAGPVIRVGDARRTFDAAAEALLQAGREALQRRDPSFKAQRHLMSGGTCEATAFGLHGYAATGIALPLGNYHNMAPQGGLAPEYIHRADLAGAAALLLSTIQEAPEANRWPGRDRLENLARAHGDRLRSTARRGLT